MRKTTLTREQLNEWDIKDVADAVYEFVWNNGPAEFGPFTFTEDDKTWVENEYEANFLPNYTKHPPIEAIPLERGELKYLTARDLADKIINQVAQDEWDEDDEEWI